MTEEIKERRKMTLWEKCFIGIIIGLLILYVVAQSPNDARVGECVKEYNKLANFTMNKCICEGFTKNMFPDYSDFDFGVQNEIEKPNK